MKEYRIIKVDNNNEVEIGQAKYNLEMNDNTFCMLFEQKLDDWSTTKCTVIFKEDFSYLRSKVIVNLFTGIDFMVSSQYDGKTIRSEFAQNGTSKKQKEKFSGSLFEGNTLMYMFPHIFYKIQERKYNVVNLSSGSVEEISVKYTGTIEENNGNIYREYIFKNSNSDNSIICVYSSEGFLSKMIQDDIMMVVK